MAVWGWSWLNPFEEFYKSIEGAKISFEALPASFAVTGIKWEISFLSNVAISFNGLASSTLFKICDYWDGVIWVTFLYAFLSEPLMFYLLF